MTALVGVVASLYLEHQQAQALQKGLEQGAPVVGALLDLLETDLVEVLGPQRLTGAKQALSSRVMYYNLQRDKLSLAERRAVLEDIREPPPCTRPWWWRTRWSWRGRCATRTRPCCASPAPGAS
ncbi:hypothetical protein ACN28S_60520 [Cystobacter fuscus]